MSSSSAEEMINSKLITRHTNKDVSISVVTDIQTPNNLYLLKRQQYDLWQNHF